MSSHGGERPSPSLGTATRVPDGRLRSHGRTSSSGQGLVRAILSESVPPRRWPSIASFGAKRSGTGVGRRKGLLARDAPASALSRRGSQRSSGKRDGETRQARQEGPRRFGAALSSFRFDWCPVSVGSCVRPESRTIGAQAFSGAGCDATGSVAHCPAGRGASPVDLPHSPEDAVAPHADTLRAPPIEDTGQPFASSPVAGTSPSPRVRGAPKRFWPGPYRPVIDLLAAGPHGDGASSGSIPRRDAVVKTRREPPGRSSSLVRGAGAYEEGVAAVAESPPIAAVGVAFDSS